MARLAAQAARHGSQFISHAARGIRVIRVRIGMFRVCSPKSYMSRVLFATPATLLAALPCLSWARVEAPVKVQYDTANGRSNWLSVNGIFVTGTELNSATRTMSYDAFSSYVVIFWGSGQAAVIRSKTFTLCGAQFTASCFPLVGRIEGADQDGRTWHVCTSGMCF